MGLGGACAPSPMQGTQSIETSYPSKRIFRGFALLAILCALWGASMNFASADVIVSHPKHDSDQSFGLTNMPFVASDFSVNGYAILDSADFLVSTLGVANCTGQLVARIWSASSTYPYVPDRVVATSSIVDISTIPCNSAVATSTFSFSGQILLSGDYFIGVEHLNSVCIGFIDQCITIGTDGTADGYLARRVFGNFIVASSTSLTYVLRGSLVDASLNQQIFFTAPVDGTQVNDSEVDVVITYDNPLDDAFISICEWNPDTLATLGGDDPCIDGGIIAPINASGTIQYTFQNTASSSHIVISAAFAGSPSYLTQGTRYRTYDFTSLGFYTSATNYVATGTPRSISKYAGLDCGGLNIEDNLKCAGLFLFYPSATLHVFDSVPSLASTTPFAYIWEAMVLWDNAFSGSATGTQTLTLEFHPMGLATTTLTAGTLESTTQGKAFFSSVRDWIEVFLYLMFAMGILYQALHIVGWVTGSHSKSMTGERIKNIGKGISNRYQL